MASKAAARVVARVAAAREPIAMAIAARVTAATMAARATERTAAARVAAARATAMRAVTAMAAVAMGWLRCGRCGGEGDEAVGSDSGEGSSNEVIGTEGADAARAAVAEENRGRI